MLKRTTMCLVIAFLTPNIAQADIPDFKVTLMQSIFNTKYQEIKGNASGNQKPKVSYNEESTCSVQARFARTAMMARQYGVNKDTVVDIIEDSKDSDVSELIEISFIRSLVQKAYEMPLKRRNPEKKDAINSFSDFIKQECELNQEDDSRQDKDEPPVNNIINQLVDNSPIKPYKVL